jgi:hypothetical protein
MNEQEAKAAADPGARTGKMPSRAEIVLAAIAVAILIGWIFSWTDSDSGREFDLFSDPFAGISFLGALLLVVYVALKPFDLLPLPPRIDSKVVPILSLLPVLGYLVSILVPIYQFLTIGGAIALAYVSATIYWRKQLEFASKTVAATVRETEDAPAAPEEAKKSRAATGPAEESAKPEGPEDPAAPPA